MLSILKDKPKIEFAESFFDSLDEMGLSEEEKQKLIDQIGEAFENGEFLNNAELISEEELQELEEIDPVRTQVPTIH